MVEGQDTGSGVSKKKWRPKQAYGSNQVLLLQQQTIFSTHKILMMMMMIMIWGFMSSDVLNRERAMQTTAIKK